MVFLSLCNVNQYIIIFVILLNIAIDANFKI